MAGQIPGKIRKTRIILQAPESRPHINFRYFALCSGVGNEYGRRELTVGLTCVPPKHCFHPTEWEFHCPIQNDRALCRLVTTFPAKEIPIP